MKYQKFFNFLQNAGKDPATLYFEDELTQLKNRRYLLNYFQHHINWDAVAAQPLSLLRIDADYLRHINEHYGHGTGDQALIHITGILKQVIPPNGLAVRYAGDEFVVLLHNTNKEDARAVAANLINQLHYDLFFSAEADTPVPLTLSIGYATAPDDARTGKGLLHQADTALYGAKQAGKNQTMDAAAVIPEAVSYKTAIHFLDNAGIVGRKSQFEVMAGALKQLGQGERGFVIIDGAPGMGKTSFLELVQRNLEKRNVNLVHVAGQLQESYRPYYLISYIAMALMRQLPDHGQAVLDSLDEQTINRIAHIIPQLIGAQDPRPEDNPAHREAIFRAFTDFFTALLDQRPLVLLIDDMDYSDPATLHLLETVYKKQPIPMLICGTASQETPSRPQAVPLELFRNAYSESLGLQSIALDGLTAEGIDKHVKMIFPGIDMPRKMARDLAAVTEGNPLFIVAVLRKMVDDGKIYHKNERWRVARLERNYFPRSLEEIIQQKKALLDEESRSFLDGASAFGESMSLSLLAGFSKERSAKIYDYINEAQAKGLVRSEFSETDENIRFSGKQVRNAIYEDIPEEIKKDIQARIGYYKEDLYNRDLLPSTAILSHHFTHSSDSGKARTYQQFQADYETRLFNPEEAGSYAESEARPGEGIARGPLSPDAMAHVPALLRQLVVALRNFRLYPAQSQSVEKAVNQLFAIIEKIHATDERISLISDKSALLVNQQEMDTSAYPRIAAGLIETWDRLELHHVTLIRGLRKKELTELVHKLSHTSGKSITPGFWQAFRRTHSLPHVDIGQIRYEKRRSPAAADMAQSPDQPAGPGAEAFPRSLAPAAFDFSDAAFQAVQQIIAGLLGAVNKFRLYPPDGPVAREAVRQLHAALQSFFARHEAIHLARVENTLLVNGVKVDASGFETLAGSLFKFFSECGMESLTFLSGTRADELTRFLLMVCTIGEGEGREGPTGPEAPDTAQMPHIRINEGVYGIQEKTPGPPPEAQAGAVMTESGEAAPMEKTEPRDLPARLRDLFLTGDLEAARNLLAELQKTYTHGDEPSKHGVLERFDSLLTPGDWKPNAEFIQLVLTPVMELLQIETRPSLINEGARLGYKAVQEFIGFGEYRLATWVMTRIRSHPETHQIQALEMPTPVLEDLVQGLDAGDKTSQQSAFQLLSSMGETVRPHLINMIKRENSLRARRLAAELLRHQGGEGAAALKRSLMNEHIPEDRARILDVIDVVSTDIQLELYYALADFKSVVRQAAGRLAERLNSPAVVEMLIQVAQGDDPESAATAVGLLGRLNALSASDTMIRLLEQSDDEELLVAVCRAMGQIGDSAFVIPLQNILRSRRSLLFRKARSSQVRVAAAYAIAQINDPRCPRILKALVDDADPRLREAARNLTG